MSKDNAARISLRALRREVTGGNYALGPHAMQHAVKEEFTVADVVQVVLTGVLVEEYPSRRRCLLYADVTIEGDYYTSDFEGEFTLDPRESSELTVHFAPEDVGRLDATLTIYSDDNQQPEIEVTLTGIGVVEDLKLYVPDDYNTIQAAIDAPRVHMQWKPDILYVEAEIPPEVVRSLRLRGWNVEQKSLWSLSQGVSVDFGAGEFFGASDARGVGTAGPRLVR